MTPPIAAKKPYEVIGPNGLKRQDEYYWLRDDTRKNPEMLAYLNAENDYANSLMAPIKDNQEKIYQEIITRIKQDDSSVPYFERDYWYYTRYEPGKDYPIYARRKGSMQAAEEIMLDGNVMAEGKEFFQIDDWVVSQDNKLLAYAEDTSGRREYVIRIKNLQTGETSNDSIKDAEANLVWADDNKTLIFIEKDPVTLLGKRVKSHVLGSDVKNAALLYEEKDASFYMGISRTRSNKYICISLESTISNEQRCTSAAKPGEFFVLAARQQDFEYQADHLDGRWIIRTNWNAPNFRLMTVPDGHWGSRDQWKELIAHDKNTFIENFEIFKQFIAIEERSDGLQKLRYFDHDGKNPNYVKTEEPAYSMLLSVNAEPNSDWLRYTYDSMTTPSSTIEVNIKTGENRVLKQDPVLGGFDADNYVTERLWAPAKDGTKIPVSLVYRKGFKKDGSAAMLQYSYGSYGISTDPYFSLSAVSMLDRGMVYALAHIRGGQEMGRAWYDNGKLLNKKNTFTDFIDVTDFLVKEGYASKDRVAAQGGSAGGLLMGAVANMAPEKYRLLIAQVPFVDVVTTMLDESIPLTTNEYDEWGNPNEQKYYDYMLSYSPYDNVEAKNYPAMYVGTGLYDSQVQYYEPAKWVARLRAKKTDTNPLLFRVNMQAGHGGKSGRFQRFKETSEVYAFMFQQLGVK
ncbi:MAG: S9 family peptidase [Arenimonas sp.]